MVIPSPDRICETNAQKRKIAAQIKFLAKMPFPVCALPYPFSKPQTLNRKCDAFKKKSPWGGSCEPW